jgi:hypothetical protein
LSSNLALKNAIFLVNSESQIEGKPLFGTQEFFCTIPIPNWPSRMPFCVTSNNKKDKSNSASHGKIEKGQAAKPRGNLNQRNCRTIV